MTQPHPEYQLVLSILHLVQRAKLHKTCLSCAHFNEGTEGCALAGGQRPPARVIATGCHAYDETPPF